MGIIACVEVTTTTTTTATIAPQSTTTVPLTTTTTGTVPPTTTTMNYCTEQKGMNQPLTIQSTQFTSNPLPSPSSTSTDINPTSSGMNFSTPNPQINITMTQPTTITVVHMPTDKPNQPCNVKEFVLVFVYPNNTVSQQFTSIIPSASATTTTTSTSTTTPSSVSGVSSATSTTSTTPSTSDILAPSPSSPQVDCPPNFQVPSGTIIVLVITLTTDGSNPSGVCRR